MPKRKLSIPSDRAAYQASQPLFDALRASCDRLEEQSHLLKATRDLSQHIHVKLDPEPAKQCTTYSLQALKQMLGIHETIFFELHATMKPGPGQLESSTCKDIARISQALKHISILIREAQENLNTTSTTTTSNDTSAESKSGVEADTAESPNATKKRKVNTPDVDVEKHPAKEDEMAAAPTQDEPKVEYQDISGEVEARIAAKKEKAQARKASRKRKRSSVDSAVGKQQTQTTVATTPDRPTAKKAKVDPSASVSEQATPKPTMNGTPIVASRTPSKRTRRPFKKQSLSGVGEADSSASTAVTAHPKKKQKKASNGF